MWLFGSGVALELETSQNLERGGKVMGSCVGYILTSNARDTFFEFIVSLHLGIWYEAAS
jgi:hypothetical protein